MTLTSDLVSGIFSSEVYEGGPICNENPFITPSTNALGSHAICQTKDQSVAVKMVHETLYYPSNLISYTLFKKHTNIHCIYFPPNCEDSFNKGRKACCIF